MLEFCRCPHPSLVAVSRRFYMYKLPNRHGKKFSGEGEKYLLLEKGSEQWTNGMGSVNESTGALGRTVGQLYANNKVRCSRTVSHPVLFLWAPSLTFLTRRCLRPYCSNKIGK